MYCKNCYVLNDEDAKYCKHCGQSLIGDEIKPKENLKDKSQKPKKVINKTKNKTINKVPKNKKEKKEKQKQNDNNVIIYQKGMTFGQKFLMFFLFLLVFLIIGFGIVIGLYYYNNQTITVPNVMNLKYETAEIQIVRNNLNVSKIEKEVKDKSLDGIVIKQTKTNQKVSKGTNIVLTVGVYEDVYIMEDLVGLDLKTAKKLLDKNDITYKIIYEESKEDDIILSQTPSKKEEISKGDIVKLTVGKIKQSSEAN